MSVAVPSDFNAEEAGNMWEMEAQFAVQATDLITDHWNALEKNRGSKISLLAALKEEELHRIRMEELPQLEKLAPGDKLLKPEDEERLKTLEDEIFEHFQQEFSFDPSKTLNEDEMKSKAGKEQWRKFIMAYEKKLDDYSVGAILRSSAKDPYTEHGTILVVRTQFYAIEIARTRAGLNDWIWVSAEIERKKKEAQRK